MSELKNVINLTLMKDNIMKVIEKDNEGYSIMVNFENSETSSESKTEQILKNIKRKYFNKAITSYKAKCK